MGSPRRPHDTRDLAGRWGDVRCGKYPGGPLGNGGSGGGWSGNNHAAALSEWRERPLDHDCREPPRQRSLRVARRCCLCVLCMPDRGGCDNRGGIDDSTIDCRFLDRRSGPHRDRRWRSEHTGNRIIQAAGHTESNYRHRHFALGSGRRCRGNSFDLYDKWTPRRSSNPSHVRCRDGLNAVVASLRFAARDLLRGHRPGCETDRCADGDPRPRIRLRRRPPRDLYRAPLPSNRLKPTPISTPP